MDNFDLLRKVSFKKRKKSPRPNKMIFGKSINLRPEIINSREEFGHWEIDTVIGIKDKNEPVLLTLTERHGLNLSLKLVVKLILMFEKH